MSESKLPKEATPEFKKLVNDTIRESIEKVAGLSQDAWTVYAMLVCLANGAHDIADAVRRAMDGGLTTITEFHAMPTAPEDYHGQAYVMNKETGEKTPV